jgi:hypothetical protein
MSNLEPYKAILEGVEDSRASVDEANDLVASAQVRLSTAQGRYRLNRLRSAEAVFDGMAAEGGEIEGERIFDFVEAAMLIKGMAASASAHTAEYLAEELSPGVYDSSPQLVMLGSGPIFVPQGSYLGGEAAPPTFSIVKQKHGGRDPEYRFTAHSDKRDIFVRRNIPRWRTGWMLTGEAALFNVGQTIPEVNRNKDVLDFFYDVYGTCKYSDKLQVINPEIVAVMALLKASIGQKPDVPFVESDDYSSRWHGLEGHKAHTMRMLQSLVNRLRGWPDPNDKVTLSSEDGIPAWLYPTALEHQGLDLAQQAEQFGSYMVTAQGIDSSDVELLNRRKAMGERLRTGQVIDRSILARVKFLGQVLETNGLAEFLKISPQAVLDTLINDPRRYYLAATPDLLGRKSSDDILTRINKEKVTRSIISTYMKRSPRFKGANLQFLDQEQS